MAVMPRRLTPAREMRPDTIVADVAGDNACMRKR
jgi:hypothetical protein